MTDRDRSHLDSPSADAEIAAQEARAARAALRAQQSHRDDDGTNRAHAIDLESAQPVDRRDTFETLPIGAYLKQQRTLRGVPIEELSALTRIPLRSLERLEGGEFNGESDGFVRGFVRTVAIALGLDADDAVARMLQEPVVGAWERHPTGRRLRQGLVIGVLSGAVLVLVLLAQAGWSLFAGADDTAPNREVVIWRDPVRGLAEATGLVVDQSAEIDPREGRVNRPPAPAQAVDSRAVDSM